MNKFEKALSRHKELPEDWIAFLNHLKDLYTKREQAKQVNFFINQYPYKREEGARDEWLPPEEFVIDGGDCEDFAIAKMLCLEYLGFSDMKIAVVYDKIRRSVHAVLHVKLSTDIYTMDNLSKAVVPVHQISHIQQSIYYVNRDGITMA